MTGDLAADLSLPNLTTFLARPAKRHGGFGLVSGGITIPYHEADLSLIHHKRPLPIITTAQKA